MYKTISFPKQESGTGEIERLRFVIANAGDEDFINWVSKLGSKELRFILGKDYRELSNLASKGKLTLTDAVLNRLKSYHSSLETENSVEEKDIVQSALFDTSEPLLGLHGTFSPNHIESIHRWYPYIEGFSSTFVETLIKKWSSNAKKIYDPFGGTGTTITVGAINGIEGFYSEVNPFMSLVIDAKTNVLKRLPSKKDDLRDYLESITQRARLKKVSLKDAQSELDNAFPGRPFFIKQRLIDIVTLKRLIESDSPDPDFKTISLLILGSIGVPSSEMKRASDLRYRRPNELLPDDYDVIQKFEEKAEQILSDIDESLSLIPTSTNVSSNALHPNSVKGIDLVLTSPPYLNGTNYFRNTKIELWLTGFIKHEKELSQFNREAMIAGINNVSKSIRKHKFFDHVEKVAQELDKVAYDRRIPELVRGYCSDTLLWLQSCYDMLSDEGRIVIDIGDSKFCGVYVPTDAFIVEIAKEIGLELIDTELVRKRNSNDGTPLKQVLLTFQKVPSKQKKAKKVESIDDYKRAALDFEKLPYKTEPFGSRNWGHSLHSLCSYQGKLKPAIAHFLVTKFTKEGDTVLDPMSGAGTIPLEAFLNGRKAIANDLQELGFILSKAKVSKPKPSDVLNEADKLIAYIEENKASVDISKYDTFGMNGKLPEYFEENTYREILAARQYMLSNSCDTPSRAIVYASLLHILHGNRPYALSRTSHPVTPFKPNGDFEYRDISSRLYDKLARALKSYDEQSFIDGEAYHSPFETLKLKEPVDAVITSPPFTASTRFYIANWMRLWMSGWEADDYKTKKDDFLEEKQKKSLDAYNVFFEKSHEWLKPNGKLILHLGKTNKVDMAAELIERCKDLFDVVHCFDEDVLGREKFGIKDQGATFAHQYLFLIKK